MLAAALALMLMWPLRPVLAGMPFGLAVTTTLDGAVPVEAPSVSHAASLLAAQFSAPAARH